MREVPKTTDVFVVGGGPAGLAAAIAARMKGFDVVVADSAQPPVDKACGEGLMPDALPSLRRLGIEIEPEHSFVFRGIRFIGEGGQVAADFRREPGLAVRRVRLHQLLIDRAGRLGVKLLWRTRVNAISEGNVSLGDSRIQCGWIIGADGERSLVRRWANLDAAHRESCRYGFRRHYQIRPWTEFMEIYWGPGCQMYVTPVGSGEACVALITRDPHLRMDAALPLFPELAHKLHSRPLASQERGAVTFTRRLKRVYRGRTVLIGDASGSLDAITGEGLSLSFRQAFVLADALATGDLKRYQATHRQMRRRPAIMAQAMLLLDRFPRLRTQILRIFSARPSIFENLLAVHAGTALKSLTHF